MLRRQNRGLPLVLAAALIVIWPTAVLAEAEPVEHYETLADLIASSDAIVVGTSVAIEEGPRLGPNGWLEGVWAKVLVEKVVWSREWVPSEIVLDGLGLRDVPPVGQTSALVLRREKESPVPHYRLVVPGSMVLLAPPGSALGKGAPEYMKVLAGLEPAQVVDRLRSLVPNRAHGPPVDGEDSLPHLLLVLGTIAVASGAALLILHVRAAATRREHAEASHLGLPR